MSRLMGAFAIVILEVHGLSGVEHTGNLAENQG